MIGAIKAVLQLSLAFHIAAQSGSPVNVVIEREFHLFEKFDSDWCMSPLRTSPAPHWFLNGFLLNDGENNTHHGVMINRNSSNEGHHQSQLTFPKLTSSINDSIVICKVNLMVILEYHLIIVEAQRVLVTDGSFHSGVCVSPLSTSPAPFFTGTLINNNTFEFNDAEANEFFSASITRNATTEGHHQALLITIIDGANYLMFNNAIITCWVNTDVILQYRLIIELNIDPTMDAEKETDATTIEISDGDTARSAISDNDVIVNTLKSPQVPSWIAAPIVLVAVSIMGVCVLLYIILLLYRKGVWCKRSKNMRNDTIESRACEDASTQQSFTDSIPLPNQPPPTSVSFEEPHGQELSATTPDTLYHLAIDHNPTPSSSEHKNVAKNTEDHRALLDITISSDMNSSFQDDKI